jgi:hypothetical protein
MYFVGKLQLLKVKSSCVVRAAFKQLKYYVHVSVMTVSRLPPRVQPMRCFAYQRFDLLDIHVFPRPSNLPDWLYTFTQVPNIPLGGATSQFAPGPQDDAELFMWLSVEDDADCAMNTRRHVSRLFLPSARNPIRVLAIIYCVQDAQAELSGVFCIQAEQRSLLSRTLHIVRYIFQTYEHNYFWVRYGFCSLIWKYCVSLYCVSWLTWHLKFRTALVCWDASRFG